MANEKWQVENGKWNRRKISLDRSANKIGVVSHPYSI
jgi:hypothetical protein